MILHGDGEWQRRVHAFVASKEQLLSNQVLIHYDPKMELRVVAYDASAYGVGAVCPTGCQMELND